MDLFTFIPEAAPAVAQPTTQPHAQPHDVPAWQPAKPGRGSDKAVTLFEARSSSYETPKKSNHSTRTIPADIVDQVEAGRVTYEAIQRLAAGHPIYTYQTCLTIHGQWPQVKQQYVMGYKHLRQNANGSMEILWPAIDADKKKYVEARLQAAGSDTHLRYTSQATTFEDTKVIQDEQTWKATIAKYRSMAERVKRSGVIATVHIFKLDTWGVVCLYFEANVQAIPAGREEALTLALMDMDTPQQYQQAVKEQQRQEAERKARMEAADKQRQMEREQAAKAQALKDEQDRPALNSWIEENTTEHQDATPQPGRTYARIVRQRTTGQLKVQLMKVQGGSFGRVKPEVWMKDDQPGQMKQTTVAELCKTYTFPGQWRATK